MGPGVDKSLRVGVGMLYVLGGGSISSSLGVLCEDRRRWIGSGFHGGDARAIDVCTGVAMKVTLGGLV